MTTTVELDRANMTCSPTYTYPNGQMPVGCSNDRAAQIQAWAASAPRGLADIHQTLDVQNSDHFPDDGSWSNIAAPIPGYLTHSNSSDGSDAWSTVQLPQSIGPAFNDHPTEVINSHDVQPGNGAGLSTSHDLGYSIPANNDGDDFAVDLDYTLNHPPYPSPIEDDMPFALSINSHTCLPGDAHDTCHGWSASVDIQGMQTGFVDGVYPNGWSDAGVDPSVSSSQSSHHPDTPLSLPQDQWDDPSLGLRAPLAIGSNHMVHAQFSDAQSTVRPPAGPQRSSLPGQWILPQSEFASQAYGSPISAFANSRRSSEGEPVCPRSNRLYQQKPREDGQYQCIFEDDDGNQCNHESFKLKCNYDKHLDSHLKPYRCKQLGCAENPFSSTACLLRHEREAHSMYNHKQVPCVVADCERSFPGKGFPRKWNALDHMKRVHHYVPPEDSNNGEAPSSPSASSMDLPFSAGSGVRAGKKQVPSPAEFVGAKKTKAKSKRSARGVGRASSSQHVSQRQITIERNGLLEQTFPEGPDLGADWAQYPPNQARYDFDQQFFHMETL